MIELVDLKLRGGDDADAAALRAARVAGRYLSREGSRDVMAVVNEIVAWFARGDVVPNTLTLELSVTSSAVIIGVTARQRIASRRAVERGRLEDALPATARRAARFGIESDHRTRVWAEFDRAGNAVVTT